VPQAFSVRARAAGAWFEDHSGSAKSALETQGTAHGRQGGGDHQHGRRPQLAKTRP